MANLNRFDFNLLLALDTLLSERSVTRAADRLCVTQPALSGSLQRLRQHFDDPLLLRVGREMELTPKARALIEPVRIALLHIDAVLETKAQFDPGTSERTFRVAMSDYCVHIYLPKVVRILSTRAPQLRLMVENVFGPSFSRLEGGDIDMVITHGDRSLFGREGRDVDLSSADLFVDSFVCVVDRDHPIGETMTKEDYLSYPHALAFFGANVRTVEEAEIERRGIVIKELLHVPTFAGLLQMLPGTELIATVQSKLAEQLADSQKLRVLRPPINLGTLQETLIWHNRNHDDPGHMWLRGVMNEAAVELT
ncbi:LysR family transcriptional regulator [Novosphingobium sp. SG707]|uniref:LysR family transcriptional regulator n=1 Tax=Novosphingobium sp. SG707 TaxID=2586996 RepID=UPI0014464911|nr:LysR family transcriptional regulator [Novosphingobium sp. SG707]NKJ00930.1 DNA-binding transcriptional LysR family regulator [Novosphingobium sp. SG707]